MLTRRDLARLAALAAGAACRPVHAAAGAAKKKNLVIAGIPIGVFNVTYIYDHAAIDTIDAVASIEAGICEIHWENLLPRKGPPSLKPLTVPTNINHEKTREALKRFPASELARIRARADALGVSIRSIYYLFRKEQSEAEVLRGFEIAKALGASAISSTPPISMVPRLETLARAHGVILAVHNMSDIAPDEIARPEDFAAALAGRSDRVAITFDTGHFVAAGQDPMPFIEKYHDRIFAMHFKDRKKNQGEISHFGEGDTPLAEILRLLKKKRWAIPLYIDCEKLPSRPAVARCLAFIRKHLA